MIGDGCCWLTWLELQALGYVAQCQPHCFLAPLPSCTITSPCDDHPLIPSHQSIHPPLSLFASSVHAEFAVIAFLLSLVSIFQLFEVWQALLRIFPFGSNTFTIASLCTKTAKANHGADRATRRSIRRTCSPGLPLNFEELFIDANNNTSTRHT